VRNGADAEVFGPVPKHQARTELGLPLNQKIVLYVGRLTQVKQIPILLQSMRLLSQTDLHLYLVGDGELKAKLIAMVEQLGIAASARLLALGRMQKYHSGSQQRTAWCSAAGWKDFLPFCPRR
jgi:glycosyltransferase involved in cell wall biosynthesis